MSAQAWVNAIQSSLCSPPCLPFILCHQISGCAERGWGREGDTVCLLSAVVEASSETPSLAPAVPLTFPVILPLPSQLS